MKTLTYIVTFQRTPDSDWGAHVADLPGCVAVAKTVDGALRRIQTAIEMHLRGMLDDGHRPPPPKLRTIRPRLDKRGSEFFATVQVAA